MSNMSTNNKGTLMRESDMEEFIKSKGLWEEFETFETQQKAKREAAIQKTSVGDLKFDFKGHRSRYCYECSGSNFNESGSFKGILRGFFEMDFVDPSSKGELDISLTKDEMERPSKASIKSVLDEAEFNKLFYNLMQFVDHKNDTFTFYLCDEFGFRERTPSNEEIKEWFGNLLIDRDEADAWRNATFESTY